MPNNIKIERYTNFSLPSRKYIPGEGPHPRKNPENFHIPPLPSCVLKSEKDDWRKCARYLYAIELFNLGYWWEAHEVLEGLWMQAGRKTQLALFIQGIIQIAAALLKYSQGNMKGALLLSDRGLEKIRRRKGVYLGIDADEFADRVENYFSGENQSPPAISLKGVNKF